MGRQAIMIVLVVAVCLVPQHVSAGLFVGDQAVDFTLLSQFNTNYTLYDHWGDVIVIDFSTMWCSHCRTEAPELQEDFWIPYQSRGVQVITILTQDNGGAAPDLADLQTWANNYGLTFPVLAAANQVGLTYGVPGYPTNFVVDQNMIIRYKVAGWSEGVHDQMLALIEDLLSDPTPAPSPTPVATPTPPPTATPVLDTPTPAPTPGPEECSFEFQLSQEYFRENDVFSLQAVLTNNGSPRMVDFYTALDVFGLYYFYPSWTEVLEFETVNLPGGDQYTVGVLGPFTWPAVDGTLEGLNFLGILTDTGTIDLISNVAVQSFGYGP
ncbi:TlpA family protein disulfide reductase [bacterium]|nr:TlpA family protein disulfide reductase [candidate division CSSED10-310 bacterium]